jgi:nicotinate phosphoribosyltransferase
MAAITFREPEAEDGVEDGVFSLLDTDLYKLTMQCAVLKYFPNTGKLISISNQKKSYQSRAFN